MPAPAIWIVLAAFAVLLLYPRPAYAYLDPGTGSLIYQTLLATALGLMFLLRGARQRVSRAIRKLFGKPDPSDTADSDRS